MFINAPLRGSSITLENKQILNADGEYVWLGNPSAITVLQSNNHQMLYVDDIQEKIVVTSETKLISCPEKSPVNIPTWTQTKTGYTPIFGIWTATSYGDWVSISQSHAYYDGRAESTGYVTNWNSATAPVIMEYRVIWEKNKFYA